MRWAGHSGARRGAQKASSRQAGEAGARGTGPVRMAMRGLGVLLGQQAVYSVHSACFDPVLTQYCS